MSEFWLCFNCCIAEQPQPKRRRRIDRSMIGEPTNFVHTAHVGSGDLFSGMNSVSSIQNQMQSKGGRDSPGSFPSHCEFLYFSVYYNFFCLVIAFILFLITKKKCDGILFTLCDYSSEMLLFCSEEDTVKWILPFLRWRACLWTRGLSSLDCS
ncbi:Hypothetical predicted protein [Marmota monax]|uniref:CDC42 small effector protein 2 n=12 Tax=Amniota TaxID=32524 RepID=A0A5E4B5S4_MARMO|nr:CDC42 small effector protein 2 [Marmota monax]VTJ64466.1 Hypothetical predicted protein [Marmota monax]